MGSHEASWGEQTQTKGTATLGGRPKGLDKTKAAAARGLVKTKAAAARGLVTVKVGASVSVRWIKAKYRKTTRKH